MDRVRARAWLWPWFASPNLREGPRAPTSSLPARYDRFAARQANSDGGRVAVRTSGTGGPRPYSVRRHHRGWRFRGRGPRGSAVGGTGPPRPAARGGSGLRDARGRPRTTFGTAWRMSLREHDWGLSAEAVPGRAIPYPRGRVIGGSSAVNATIALRGVPADYDEWAALGNDAWSWAQVLPHFRRLEDDPEGADELHGRGGPIAIRRWRRDELIPTQRAFFDGLPAPRLPRGRRPQPSRGIRRRPLPAEPTRPLAALHRDRLPAARPAAAQPHHPAAAPRQPRPRRGPPGRRDRSRVRCDGENGSSGGGSRSPPARSARRPSSCARASGQRPRCSTSASSRWWICPASARASWITRSRRLLLVPRPGSCDPRDPPCAGRLALHGPRLGASSTTCSSSCSATSTWRASAARRRWQWSARRSRSGSPSRSNARSREAACRSRAPTRAYRRWSSSTSRPTRRTCAGSWKASASPGRSRTSRRSRATPTTSPC